MPGSPARSGEAAERPEERALVDRIEAESERLDRIFRDRIVPAVLRGDASRRPGGARPRPARRDPDPGPHPGARRRFEAADPGGAARTPSGSSGDTLLVLVALLAAAPLVAVAVSVAIAPLHRGAGRAAPGRGGPHRGGDLDARIEVSGAPELEALAAAGTR